MQGREKAIDTLFDNQIIACNPHWKSGTYGTGEHHEEGSSDYTCSDTACTILPQIEYER